MSAETDREETTREDHTEQQDESTVSSNRRQFFGGGTRVTAVWHTATLSSSAAPLEDYDCTSSNCCMSTVMSSNRAALYSAYDLSASICVILAAIFSYS